MMAVRALLSQRKEAILKGWLSRVAETYPSGALLFQDKDPFTNPVGHIFTTEMETLLDELLKEEPSPERLYASLEGITRITAVQELTPGAAVAFVFHLKGAVREALDRDLEESGLWEALMTFEARIDERALLAFSAYMQARERVYEARVSEIRAARDDAFRMLERMMRRRDKVEAE